MNVSAKEIHLNVLLCYIFKTSIIKKNKFVSRLNKIYNNNIYNLLLVGYMSYFLITCKPHEWEISTLHQWEIKAYEEVPCLGHTVGGIKLRFESRLFEVIDLTLSNQRYFSADLSEAKSRKQDIIFYI